MKSDTPTLTFKARTWTIKYGDNLKFYEYKVLIFQGNDFVGMEEGARRNTVDRASCLKAARSRIKELRTHRLFVVRVTKKDIDNGTARSCRECAISQALWHNQERMGYSQEDFDFEVSPYGCFVDPRGIVLSSRWGDRPQMRLSVNDLPLMESYRYKTHVNSSPMDEWAMSWDDWAEFRYMSRSEWREDHGGDDSYPFRPAPCSFVLDMDAFREEE